MSTDGNEEGARFYRCPACELPHIAGDEPEDCPLRADSSGTFSDTVVSEGPRELNIAIRPGALIAERYVLEERIGEGGMGAVFRAKDLRSGRIVALKTILGDFDQESKAGRRFLREGRLMASLTHPGVVRVMDFGIVGGTTAFLVMELVTGTPLDEMIENQSPLPIGTCCSLACQCLATLSVIHESGVVHCDLKPANIVVTTSPDHPGQLLAKLLDFGLSKETRASASRITEAGVIQGTPFYLAPDMLRGVDASVHTDLYAMGLIFYEMLAGRLPLSFDDLNMVEVFSQILKGRRVPVESFRPGVSAELALVANRAAGVLGEPFPSAVELLYAIDATQADLYQKSELAKSVPLTSGETRLS